MLVVYFRNAGWYPELPRRGVTNIVNSHFCHPFLVELAYLFFAMAHKENLPAR